MSSIIDKFKTVRSSTMSRNTRRSTEWLANKIKSGDIERKYLTNIPKIGRMYLYKYDPKHKATLPYYDINPLVIPIDIQGDSMLGLNLHYLPPRLRVLFLDKLLDYRSGTTNERSYMKLSYSLLVSATRFKEVKPTIHRYLFSHVRSKFAIVPPDEWEYAVTLPLARFVGESNSNVYKFSREKF